MVTSLTSIESLGCCWGWKSEGKKRTTQRREERKEFRGSAECTQERGGSGIIRSIVGSFSAWSSRILAGKPESCGTTPSRYLQRLGLAASSCAQAEARATSGVRRRLAFPRAARRTVGKAAAARLGSHLL